MQQRMIFLLPWTSAGTGRTVRCTAMHPDNWCSLTMTLQWNATGEWWREEGKEEKEGRGGKREITHTYGI